jgi:acyl carrier protein
MERLIVTVLRDLAAEVLPEDLTQDTPLFGDHGLLDSVGLVSLVVGVEQAIQERFGIALSLADEKALSQRQSPYRTVGSLADYAFRAM